MTSEPRGWLPLVVLLALVCALNVALMPASFVGGDSIAWHEEARSLLRDGRLSVDPQLALHAGDPGEFFVLNEVDRRWYSKHGIANTAMAIPVELAEELATGRIPSAGVPPNVLVIDLYNVALSVALCAVLYGISGSYSRRPVVRAIFTLACLYATYLWYYQRAQTSEIYQTLFFCGAFALLTTFLRDLRANDGRATRRGKWALAGAWACVGMLVLTRLLFALALPIVIAAVAYEAASTPRERRARVASALAPWMVVPPLVILASLAWANHAKFGSVWLTGYHQWKPREHLPTGNPVDGLRGFLFDPRYSILLHFPVLVLAIAGFRPFVARHRTDALVMLAAFALFLGVTSMIPTWRGEWGYGPRYLLFLLPVLSLPALCFLDGVADRWGSPRSGLLAAAAALLLGYSAYLQVQVNRCDFFAYYFVRNAIPAPLDDELTSYFYDHGWGKICCDLVAHRADPEHLPFFPAVMRATSARRAGAYRELLVKLLSVDNFYWSSSTSPARGASANREDAMKR